MSTGSYHATPGKKIVKSVTGSSITRLHSSNGEFNGVDQTLNTTTYVGLYHKSGALNYVIDNGATYGPIYHKNGSLRVTTTGAKNGAIDISVV